MKPFITVLSENMIYFPLFEFCKGGLQEKSSFLPIADSVQKWSNLRTNCSQTKNKPDRRETLSLYKSNRLNLKFCKQVIPSAAEKWDVWEHFKEF